MNSKYLSVVVLGVAVIFTAIFWLYFQNQSPVDQINNNQNITPANVNQTASNQVPRIIQSGNIVSADEAISNPSTVDWKSSCLTNFPCFQLPTAFAACPGADPSYIQIVNQGTCDNPDTEAIMNISNASFVGSDESVIAQTSEMVSPAFQKVSDTVTGSLGENKIFCLDDTQMRHCVLTLPNTNRFLVDGYNYFDQPAEKTAFDGIVRSLKSNGS